MKGSKEGTCWVVMKQNPQGQKNEIIQSCSASRLEQYCPPLAGLAVIPSCWTVHSFNVDDVSIENKVPVLLALRWSLGSWQDRRNTAREIALWYLWMNKKQKIQMKWLMSECLWELTRCKDLLLETSPTIWTRKQPGTIFFLNCMQRCTTVMSLTLAPVTRLGHRHGARGPAVIRRIQQMEGGLLEVGDSNPPPPPP